MKNLHFTQDPITPILTEVASGQEGLLQVLMLPLEAAMRAERKLRTEEQED